MNCKSVFDYAFAIKKIAEDLGADSDKFRNIGECIEYINNNGDSVDITFAAYLREQFDAEFTKFLKGTL